MPDSYCWWGFVAFLLFGDIEYASSTKSPWNRFSPPMGALRADSRAASGVQLRYSFPYKLHPHSR